MGAIFTFRSAINGFFSYCKMHFKCIHIHSNECSENMCVIEQSDTIHYNLYTHTMYIFSTEGNYS